MTSKHWLKMVGGMLLIFIFGMMATSALRAGVRRASEAVVVTMDVAAVPIRVDGYPFLMDGKAVGALEKLGVRRAKSGSGLSSFEYTVRLDDTFSVRRFASCHLVPVTPGEVTATSDWRCIHREEPGYSELRQFGTITFLPSHERHLLMVPGEFAAKMREIAADDVTTELGRDVFRLTVNGATLVNVQGRADGADGGSVTVTNPATGETVVQVEGGRDGGHVTVGSKRP